MNNGLISGFNRMSGSSANAPQLGAGIVTNPLHLPIAAVNETTTYFKQSSTAIQTTLSLATPNGFVSALINSTSSVNLLSLNGSGFLTHVFSPVGDAGSASIATITMTVDGVVYRFSNTAGLSAYLRLMIGATAQGKPITVSTASTADQLNGIGGYNDAGHTAKTGKHVNAYYNTIPTPHQIASYSMPRLRFEKSLSVDIQMSVTPATTVANSQYAVAGYTLD